MKKPAPNGADLLLKLAAINARVKGTPPVAAAVSFTKGNTFICQINCLTPLTS